MNNTLHWYETDRWLQRLEHNTSYSVPSEAYPFPMEEVLYQLLLHAVTQPSVSSCAGLDKLWEEYRALVPEAAATPDEMIGSGWLCVCCDRWRVAGHRYGFIDESTGSVFHVLHWLRSRQFEAEGVLIRDASGALARSRKLFPALPEAEWFIQRHILSENGARLICLGRGEKHYLYGALVRLWFYGGLRPEDWAELASSLRVSAALLRRFPREAKKDVMAVLASRFLRGAVPTLEQLNISMDCFYACERGEPVPERTVHLVADDIERLADIEHGVFKSILYDLLPQDFMSFEAAAVAENIDSVPAELLPEVLDRLAALHRIGGMSTERLTPKAALGLIAYPESRTLALLTLAERHRESTQQGDPTAGNALLAWLRFALEQPVIPEISCLRALLSYLAESSYRGMRQDQADAELLRAVLSLFSRAAARDARFAEKLSSALSGLLSPTGNGVTWCRRFRLLCDWAELVCGEQPDVLISAELVSLRGSLTDALNLLLGDSYEKRAAFVPSAIFGLRFWPKLFSSVDQQTRFRLRTTVRSWYDSSVRDHDRIFRARDQFALALAWLAALVQAFPEDRTLEAELEELLALALRREHMILSGAFATGDSHKAALRSAIGAVRLDAQADSPLLNLDSGASVTILAYARDETLQERIKARLQASMTDEELLDDLRWSDSFDQIFEEHLEFLYDFCEHYLSQTYAEQIRKGRAERPYTKHLLFQLSHLWYVRGEAKRILQEGDDWWRARVYTEEGQQQDLRRAAELWKNEAHKTRRSDAYLNWLLSLLWRMEEQPDKSADAGLRREIAALRQEIEAVHWESWGAADQLQYARLMVFYATMCGHTKDSAIGEVSASLKLDTATAAELRAALAEEEPKLTLPQDADSLISGIAAAIKEFRTLSFQGRARAYLESFSERDRQESETSLLLYIVLNAIYHLQMYGDKLSVAGSLGEDHCTQLLREMINAFAGEKWGIIANDQQQSSSTGKKNAQGVNNSAENDLVLRNLGYEKMVIESQVSDNIRWAEVWKHLYKLIGDSRNRPIMLLFYGHDLNPIKRREAIMQHIREEMQMPQMDEVRFTALRPLREAEALFIPTLFEQLPSELVDHCMVTEVSHPGGEDIPLFVLYADITRRAHAELSKRAREGKPSQTRSDV